MQCHRPPHRWTLFGDVWGRHADVERESTSEDILGEAPRGCRVITCWCNLLVTFACLKVCGLCLYDVREVE